MNSAVRSKFLSGGRAALKMRSPHHKIICGPFPRHLEDYSAHRSGACHPSTVRDKAAPETIVEKDKGYRSVSQKEAAPAVAADSADHGARYYVRTKMWHQR